LFGNKAKPAKIQEFIKTNFGVEMTTPAAASVPPGCANSLH
jgi:hypothetical protein